MKQPSIAETEKLQIYVSKEAKIRLRMNADAQGVTVGELVSTMVLSSLPESAAGALAACK